MKSKTRGKGRPAKAKVPIDKQFLLQSTTYFITFKGILPDSGQRIDKNQLLNFLLNQCSTNKRLPPQRYLLCQQTYQSGQPHYHVILVYPKRKKILESTAFDYRGIHPNIQPMRNMKAALQYVYKEDPHPLTNMDVVQQKRIARAKDSSSLYPLLRQQMMKDPFNFEVMKYCLDHNLDQAMYKANYSKAVHLLRKVQEAYCNKLLFQKPGFKFISRSHIQSRLSPSELITYDSWPGYQTIVNYLNIMNKDRGARQQKSKNLLITGPPSTGKSALFWQRTPLPGRTSIVNHLSLYPMGMKDWFPEYKSDVYAGIYWNEAKLTSYSYDVILQLLDGSPVMLPAKGGGHKKVDNPLVIMTSNMTLVQMIKHKFQYNKQLQRMARLNLSERVQNVIIPKGYDLFLLQKLLVPLVT